MLCRGHTHQVAVCAKAGGQSELSRRECLGLLRCLLGHNVAVLCCHGYRKRGGSPSPGPRPATPSQDSQPVGCPGNLTLPVCLLRCVCVCCRTKSSLGIRWNAPADNGATISEYCLEWDQGTGQICAVEIRRAVCSVRRAVCSVRRAVCVAMSHHQVSLYSCFLAKRSSSSGTTSSSLEATPTSGCGHGMPLAGVRTAERPRSVPYRQPHLHPCTPPYPPAPLTPSPSTGPRPPRQPPLLPTAWRWTTLTL